MMACVIDSGTLGRWGCHMRVNAC